MRDVLIRIYSRFDGYLTAMTKFVISFFTLFCVCRSGEVAAPLNRLPILLIIAAFCSFLPQNFLLLTGCTYLLLQFYFLSLEAAVVGGVVLLVLLLLYFSFIPEQAYVVIGMAVLLGLKVPFAIPVICALLLGPEAIIGILLGTAVWTLADYLKGNTTAAAEMNEAFFNHILELFENLFLQRELILTAVILTAVFLVVYLIRRLPVRWCWHLAIFSGGLVYGLLSGMRAILPGNTILPVRLGIDLLIGFAVGCILLYFCFSLDYAKVEYLQFEDDSYYYYVKAVPKRMAARNSNGEEKGDYQE